MRTLIDIPDGDLKQLTRLSKQQKLSRSHLVRTAISEYLSKQGDSLHMLAGIWGDRVEIDGLEYQLAMRREWDRES